MDILHVENLKDTVIALYGASKGIFWETLPLAFLLSMLMIFATGGISGEKLLSLFRRTIIAIALLVAFPQISNSIRGLESYLVGAYGGETSLSEIFKRVADRAAAIDSLSSHGWLKIGETLLTVVSTLSFLILAVVKHFLDVLRITTWNLLHIVAPLSFLACLFPSFHQIPKGVFIGMLELALWKPVWIILMKILVVLGFGEVPTGATQWIDTIITNFAVAGLIASTPIVVHGFLSGTLAAAAGGSLQTMTGGLGTSLVSAPIQALRKGVEAGRKTGGKALSAVATFIRKSPPINPNKKN